MPTPLPLAVRMRRLRGQPQLRRMLPRVVVRRSDIVVPVFVTEGTGVRREIKSMPGVSQMSVDVAVPWLEKRAEEGFAAYLVFGVIDRAKKDAIGTEAMNPANVVCELFRAMRGVPMVGVSDLCFCEYTDHGHCGRSRPAASCGTTRRSPGS